MTITDYDRREKACPICNAHRLIFITDAPHLRPIGKSVQYRCKDCAIREAEIGNDPLEIVRHVERRALANAWEDDRASPHHANACRVGKGIRPERKVDEAPTRNLLPQTQPRVFRRARQETAA